MVNKGIVLDDVISSEGIEVDNANINFITSLHLFISVKDIRPFLGHASFFFLQ